MSARAETWAWLAQRASAALLAVCVAVHLATMIVAVRGGLSAADILGRTRGSAVWAAFYGLFVVAVAIHAPLGLRTIAS
ncbi:MAG TPA: succinate dehydrogenase, partial [Casimicrobiaceae bacterium]|nr:succinate dehydrogenase [Casimicrobiaceae bacterium]